MNLRLDSNWTYYVLLWCLLDLTLKALQLGLVGSLVAESVLLQEIALLGLSLL